MSFLKDEIIRYVENVDNNLVCLFGDERFYWEPEKWN